MHIAHRNSQTVYEEYMTYETYLVERVRTRPAVLRSTLDCIVVRAAMYTNIHISRHP